MIRTTITLPQDLYEELRATAYYQRKTISELIRERIRSKNKVSKPKTGQALRALKNIAKLTKNKPYYKFDRKKFYDEIIRHKMSFGY